MIVVTPSFSKSSSCFSKYSPFIRKRKPNSSRLKSVLERFRFRDGLVCNSVVDLTIEIMLSFQISPRSVNVASNKWDVYFYSNESPEK